ncbi:MAG TPA: ABC transporter ATP-binding protein [Ktedonobacterales bacterium]|nr:ABC transporter ATP-binding protein [Ktedonobacterales bacterium]
MATVEFDDVTKTYLGATQNAVDHVSFSVEKGALCILLGTSGSGKTTLLRMVNRLADPTSGVIRVDGTATTEQDPIALRRRIGYVIQQVGLFPHLTVEENVRVVPSILGQKASETSGRVDELLTLVGLEPAEYRTRYPRQLSGGQQQRVGLARALAADPALLLMDEPFGALDAITRGRLQDELLRIQRETGKTILFVTHDVDEAFKLGTQVVVMDQGRLMQEGAPVELLAHPANAFVGQLVGSANALRQLEFLPASAALEPQAPADAAGSQRISAHATLLEALLQLMQSKQSALTLEEHGRGVGQITLSGISRVVLAARRMAAEQAAEAEERVAATPEAV